MIKTRIYGIILMLAVVFSGLVFSDNAYAREVIVTDINGDIVDLSAYMDEPESNSRSFNLMEYADGFFRISESEENWNTLNDNAAIYEGLNRTDLSGPISSMFSIFDVAKEVANGDTSVEGALAKMGVSILEGELGVSNLRYYQNKTLKIATKLKDAGTAIAPKTMDFINTFVGAFDPKTDFYSVDNIMNVDNIDPNVMEGFRKDVFIIIEAQDGTKGQAIIKKDSNDVATTTSADKTSTGSKEVDVDSFISQVGKVMEVSKGTRLYSSSGHNIDFVYEVEIIGDGCFDIGEKYDSELVVGTIDDGYDFYDEDYRDTIENVQMWEVISLENGMLTLLVRQ